MTACTSSSFPIRRAYNTLSTESRIRLEERRSVFIGTAAPVSRESDASDLLSRVRSEFPDASHHVYGWILGGEVSLQKHSDDGEPQGTAGLPVLDVLRKQSLENAIVVVTRYFGGVLLGAGGLVRAYGRAASLAVETAGPVSMLLYDRFRITLPYADFDRFRYRALQLGYRLDDPLFGMDVDIIVSIPEGETERLQSVLDEATAGAGLMLKEESCFIPEKTGLEEQE